MSIEISYNIWADQYDSNENKTRDLDQIATVEVLSKYSFDTVLELGCGTGKNTEWLIKKALEVIGLDISKKMLAIAANKINNENVTFMKADLGKPWITPNNYFDLVTCSLTLEHIKNVDFIFSQASDKLKTGGKFFVCELHPFKQYLGSKACYESDGEKIELEVYQHHLTEYLDCSRNTAFKLLDLREWFDEKNEEIPRLISFVFEKR